MYNSEEKNTELVGIAYVVPEPIMNLMLHGATEKGFEALRCAGLYTVDVDGAGLADKWTL